MTVLAYLAAIVGGFGLGVWAGLWGFKLGRGMRREVSAEAAVIYQNRLHDWMPRGVTTDTSTSTTAIPATHPFATAAKAAEE